MNFSNEKNTEETNLVNPFKFLHESKVHIVDKEENKAILENNYTSYSSNFSKARIKTKIQKISTKSRGISFDKQLPRESLSGLRFKNYYSTNLNYDTKYNSREIHCSNFSKESMKKSYFDAKDACRPDYEITKYDSNFPTKGKICFEKYSSRKSTHDHMMSPPPYNLEKVNKGINFQSTNKRYS